MVVSANKAMSWFSDLGIKKAQASKQRPVFPPVVGVLCFEIAKTMSRLISLYKSLTDDEVYRLKNHVVKAKGIAYLNSKDETYLLGLAFAERLEELDDAASLISRLGRKCSDFGLMRFDLVNANLMLGSTDVGKMDHGSKDVKKLVQKLERYVARTSMLYTATEHLTELETSEKKLSHWRKAKNSKPSEKTNLDLFDQKIAFQRRQVRHFKEISLWSQTLDKCVAPMARITCIIYAKLCKVFGPYLSDLPAFCSCQKYHESPQHTARISKSGSILKPSKKPVNHKLHSGEMNTVKSKEFRGLGVDTHRISFQTPDDTGKNKNRIFHGAPPSTVGGAGLTVRYANIILLAESYLDNSQIVSSSMREKLCQMLPENLKTMVTKKLKKWTQKRNAFQSGATEEEDLMLAEGWREGLTGILDWIGPKARDTLEWQMQRNWEKKQGFEAKQRVLLMQTLHYADLEKTEAVIVELLVGLSCVYKYENRLSSP